MDHVLGLGMSVTYATPQDSLVFLVDDWTAGYVRVLEGVEKRRVELEPKVAKPGELTVAMATAALTPVWKTQANWFARQIWVREILGFFGVETAIAAIDQAKADAVYAGVEQPLVADDIAEAIVHSVELPGHVNLDLVTLRPVAQAAAHKVIREPLRPRA